MPAKLVLLALLAGLAAWALSPQWRSFDEMGERRTQALSRRPPEILVGVVWPFVAKRDGMADGLQLAVEQINAEGLAGGIPMRLILRDDKSDWQRAKRIAVEFADTPNMSAVVGYYSSSVATKASTIYEPSRLLHLIVGANSTPMTDHGFQYIVRTILSGDKIARSLAAATVGRGHRKIAVIREEGAYGEDLAYQYIVSLNNLEAKVVYEWSYSAERPDFRMVVRRLKRSDADLIFFAGLEPGAGDFIRLAREVGIKTEIIGAFSDSPEMHARAGAALEGAIYFDFYDVNSPRPENQAFVRQFRLRYRRAPDTWAAQGYDALRMLARAVRDTASAGPLELAYAMRFMDPWEGANGLYKFDGRGELDDRPIFLNMYRNGAPVTILTSTPIAEPTLR